MDVLCLGIFVADVLAKPVEKVPERGRLELFDEMELHTGGCANNTAIGLAKLGISSGAMGKILMRLNCFLVHRLFAWLCVALPSKG